jgi:hypothetical protein
LRSTVASRNRPCCSLCLTAIPAINSGFGEAGHQYAQERTRREDVAWHRSKFKIPLWN